MRNKVLQKRILATVAASTMLYASQAWAAEEVFQLDQVIVTADRVVTKVNDTASNVTVITGEELKNKGARTLADALTGVSGVIVKRYGGGGEKAIPYILGTDRVVVLIDGKRVNLPQGIGTGNGGVDLNTVLLGDNIERIEVVHGGASTLYGADAVGGVINVLTKKGNSSTPTTATVAGGSHGSRYYSLNTGGQENKTHWQFAAAQDSGDGQRANSAYKGKSVSFRLDQDLAKGENLTFTYDYYGSHTGIPGSLTWSSLTDSQNILRHNWSVGYSKEHADGNRLIRYYDNEQTYSGENSGSFRHQNTVRAFEYQDSARLNEANVLTWGGEWRKDKVSSTGESDGPHDSTTKAVYIQNQYSINSAAKLTFGLRRDANSLYGTHWLPQASYLYQINPNTSYFANWSKVFKAPKFDDLYGDDGWGNTGNPNLKAETGWTTETGIKSKLNSSSEMTLSVFKRDITNAIRWVETSPYIYHPQNIDRLQTMGVTASLTTKLSNATTSDVGYTYMDSRDQNDNNIGDPRNSFHIGLNIHQGKLTQSIYGIYVGESGITTGQVSGHFVANTNTTYDLNKDTSIFLKVNNLFNKQYQDVKNYPANGRMIMLGIKQTI